MDPHNHHMRTEAAPDGEALMDAAARRLGVEGRRLRAALAWDRTDPAADLARELSEQLGRDVDRGGRLHATVAVDPLDEVGVSSDGDLLLDCTVRLLVRPWPALELPTVVVREGDGLWLGLRRHLLDARGWRLRLHRALGTTTWQAGWVDAGSLRLEGTAAHAAERLLQRHRTRDALGLLALAAEAMRVEDLSGWRLGGGPSHGEQRTHWVLSRTLPGLLADADRVRGATSAVGSLAGGWTGTVAELLDTAARLEDPGTAETAPTEDRR